MAVLGDVEQTVVTGNIGAVAETKLAVFGLDTHIRFPLGGYGEDDDDRAELVRIAIRRASRSLDITIEPRNVLLIGDTPADVAAGLANDIRILAVATGQSSAKALNDAGADLVAPDLEDPPRDSGTHRLLSSTLR
ncbi:HAD hydrolase-like protein [Streptomyces sp. M10(2022)]